MSVDRAGSESNPGILAEKSLQAQVQRFSIAIQNLESI